MAVLKHTVIPSKEGGFVLVSTTDLGDAYNNLGGRFETMVFPCTEDGTVTDWGDLDAARTPHFAEILEQHMRLVARWKAAP